MRTRHWLRVSLVAGMMTGCVPMTPLELSPAGSQILPLASDPGGACTTLGDVVGGGQGMYLPERLESALNDAKNKAAQQGATHILLSPPITPRDSSYVAVTGIAYRCPQGAPSQAPTRPGPSVAVPAPKPYTGPKTFLDNCPAQEGESARERALRCRASTP
jgi:hypothetical protein